MVWSWWPKAGKGKESNEDAQGSTNKLSPDKSKSKPSHDQVEEPKMKADKKCMHDDEVKLPEILQPQEQNSLILNPQLMSAKPNENCKSKNVDSVDFKKSESFYSLQSRSRHNLYPIQSIPTNVSGSKRVRVTFANQQNFIRLNNCSENATTHQPVFTKGDAEKDEEAFIISDPSMSSYPDKQAINMQIKTKKNYLVNNLRINHKTFGFIEFHGKLDLSKLGSTPIDISKIIKFRQGGVQILDHPSFALRKLRKTIILDMKKEDFTEDSKPITKKELDKTVSRMGKSLKAEYSHYNEEEGKWHLIIPPYTEKP